MIQIPKFDSATLEESIIFVDVLWNGLVGQNVVTGPQYMERVLRRFQGYVSSTG